MDKFFQYRMRISMILFLVFVVTVTCGCEPLRKKFTRKKKIAVDNQAIAILDPIDYPDKIRSTAESYKEHYDLWRVWHSDLATIIEDNANEKKIRYTLGQMWEQLTAMQKLLTLESQKSMSVYINDVEVLTQEYEKPSAFRNKSVISSKVRALGRNVKEHFAPNKVQGSLAAL